MVPCTIGQELIKVKDNFKVINYVISESEITDAILQRAILSTNETGVYLIKIIHNNLIIATLQGHNVNANYRFFVLFTYYDIRNVNRIKSYRYRNGAWTINTYITDSDMDDFKIWSSSNFNNLYPDYALENRWGAVVRLIGGSVPGSFKTDTYYLRTDSSGKLYTGLQINGSQSIKWTEK